MKKLLFIALAGALAQLIDGSLGMGFGATSTTLLIVLASLGPAQASAVVHVAELGTTLVSGASHAKFANVDWKVVLLLGAPGAIGGFLGATVLATLPVEIARPITAVILAAIGVNLMWRFAKGSSNRRVVSFISGKFLGVLGFFGGFIDASGGGGWGPITSSTLLTLGNANPRRIIGTVNTAEFLVSASASAAFLINMWQDIAEHLLAVGGLLLGGVLFAPVAAWLVSKINPGALGILVGTTLILTNLPELLGPLGLSNTIIAALSLVLAVFGIVLTVRAYRRVQRAHRVEAQNFSPISGSQKITLPSC